MAESNRDQDADGTDVVYNTGDGQIAESGSAVILSDLNLIQINE